MNLFEALKDMLSGFYLLSACLVFYQQALKVPREIYLSSITGIEPRISSRLSWHPHLSIVNVSPNLSVVYLLERSGISC